MHVAVAGAGIAGLTTAIALSRRGFSVDIHERAPAPREVGAGIQLSPNAISVLARLGIEPRLAGLVSEPAAIEIRSGGSGRMLARLPLGETARRRYGAPYYLIHRADLQAALLAEAEETAGIRLFFDSEIDDAAAGPAGVSFAHAGGAGSADLLVAADGVNSRLRTSLFGYSGPRGLDKIAWRGTIDAERAPASIPRDVTGLWLGPGAHVVHYPVSRGARLNVVLISGDVDEAGTLPVTRFAAPVRDLAETVGRWTPWPLRVIETPGPWSRGRVVLVGDAKHAMAPSAAQGGAQAIEDAWALASCLAATPGDLPAALARFEAIRRPRVERIAREALRNLAIYNLKGPLALARNIVIAGLPERAHLARLDWLYGHKAG
jgi:salicylate hydroxylase